MSKLVSVVIPCYNSSKTICETLESVCNQTYSNIEIIIVNDGSSDDSENVINNYIATHSDVAIQYYKQKNLGPSITRNNGAKYATGHYLLFLDADDLIANEYLSKCVGVFNANNHIKIVYANAVLFGVENTIWNLKTYSFPSFLIYNSIYISALVKREDFIAVGSFDEKLSFTEDWDLWLSFVDNFGENIVHKIDEPLFYYRKHNDQSSLTDNKLKDNNEEIARLHIYNKHFQLYQKYNMDLKNLFLNTELKNKFEKKYYSIWYKNIFYLFKKKS